MTNGNETLVSIDAIGNSPSVQTVPSASDLSRDPLTGRDQRFDQELGSIGKHIGGGVEKAGNIAFVVIVSSGILLLMTIIATTFVTSPEAQKNLGNVTTSLIAVVTGAMGYLFGSSKKA